jgi:Holliday junction resolvase RusA-like endonuclease
MITAIVEGEPNTATAQQKGVMVRNGRPMFFTKKKVKVAQDLLVARLRVYAPRKPIDFPVLVKVKFAFGRTKARPHERRHGKRPDIDNLLKGVLDALGPAGWLADDGLVDQLVAEKCRVEGPYLEVTMKEAL